MNKPTAPAADAAITVAVPRLRSFTLQSGLGRVLGSLQAAWAERVVLVESDFRRSAFPVLRNFPAGIAVAPGAELVLLPQLTGAQALKQTGGLPSLAIVHDIGIVDFPGDRAAMDWISYAATLGSFYGLRNATQIITPSHFTQARLLEYLPALKDRVVAIHSGVSELFLSYATDQATARELLERQIGRKLRSPLLLYVGSELPRKNIPLLLQVFQQIKRRYPEAQLLKVGTAGRQRWRTATSALCSTLGLELGADVVLLEGIADDLLAHCYRAADVFLSTSSYEGFGLPALESLAVGTPVVVTDQAALPEIVGRAGLVVAPEVAAFVQAIEQALSSAAQSDSARLARRQHAQPFTWRRTADRYLAIMHHLTS